jgi:hypothetical protein
MEGCEKRQSEYLVSNGKMEPEPLNTCRSDYPYMIARARARVCVCVCVCVCRTPSLITREERRKKPLIPSSVNSPPLKLHILLSTLFFANIFNICIYHSMNYEAKFKHHLLQSFYSCFEK